MAKLNVAFSIAVISGCTSSVSSETPGGHPDAGEVGGSVRLVGIDVTDGPLGGGSAVVLSGSGFVDGSGSLSVSFGGKAAVVTGFDDTSASVTVPPGTVDGSIDVSISNGHGVSTLSGAFAYTCPTSYVGYEGKCVDVATHNENCGQRGNVCSETTTCLASQCTVPAALPSPTHRPGRSAVVGPNGKIYLVADYPGDAQTQVFDPRTNTWASLPGAPTRISGRAVSVGGRIHIPSFSSHGETPAPPHYVFDVATNSWASRAVIPVQQNRSATAALPNGLILVMGALDFDEDSQTSLSSARVRAYNPQTDTWTSLPPMTTPRCDMPAVTGSDGRVYVLSDNCSSANRASSEVFDPATNTWSPIAPMQGRTPYLPSAAASPDGKIYLAGRRDFKIYDIATNTWTDGPQLGILHRDGALLGLVYGHDGRVYAIGGGAGNTRVRAVQVYDPRRGTWISSVE